MFFFHTSGRCQVITGLPDILNPNSQNPSKFVTLQIADNLTQNARRLL
jgi:hypothetical protein